MRWALGSLPFKRPEDPQNSRLSEYRAPTWSWASVDGEVFWKNSPRVKRNTAKKTEVIDCEVLEVNSKAPFGTVKDGTLKISAVTKEIIWDGTLIRRIRSRHERRISSYSGWTDCWRHHTARQARCHRGNSVH